MTRSKSSVLSAISCLAVTSPSGQPIYKELGVANSFCAKTDQINGPAGNIQVIPKKEIPGYRTSINLIRSREKFATVENSEEVKRRTLKVLQDKCTRLNSQYFTGNVANVIPPDSYAQTEKWMNAFKRLNQESGARFGAIHMAGDEVSRRSWEPSPARIAFGKSFLLVNSGMLGSA